MSKRFLLTAAVTLVLFASPRAADAFVNELTVTIGGGAVFKDGKASRLPVSFELLPSYSLWLFKLDMGFYLAIDKPADLVLRPGFRFGIPLIYFRGGAHLKVTHGADYGFLAGIGTEPLGFGPVSLVLEIDTYLTKDGKLDSIPIEARAGVSIGF